MINRPDTRSQRLKRHKRVRAKISGTPERPRLNVFRSETNIYAPRPRALRPWSSTAAAMSTTAASRLWPRAPVRAACSSKGGGNDNG